MKKPNARQVLWDYLPFLNRQSGPINQRSAFLRNFIFFRNMSNRQLKHIRDVLYERTYREGEYIFEVDQPGAALFIIEEGEIAVEVMVGPNKYAEVATLAGGSFFGELALLDHAPRSASARAKKTSRVLALFRSDLDKLIDTAPDVAACIYKALATVVGERLKATNELIDENRAA